MHRWDPKPLLLFQSHRPIVFAALSFIAGICTSLPCRHYTFGNLAFGTALLLVASILAYRRGRILEPFVLAQAAIVLCGMLTGIAHRDGRSPVHLQTLLAERAFALNEPVLFEGRVAEEGRQHGSEVEIVVKLERYRSGNAWFGCSGKGILRIAAGNARDRGLLENALTRSAAIRAWAVWKKPLNFENPGSTNRTQILARNDIFLIGRTKSPLLIESLSNRHPGLPAAAANFTRKRVRAVLERIGGSVYSRQKAVLAGLLIGDRSNLDGKTREVFQNAGAFHILVVSGLHVAWITGICLILLKSVRIPERLRYPSAAVVILLYTWAVGSQPGITRCIWMFSLYFAGRLMARRTDSVNILFCAALLLLDADPDRLFEAGYQLSFLSVAAIALTALPAIEGRLKALVQPVRCAGLQDRLFLRTGQWHRWGRRARTRCELLAEQVADTLPRIRAGALCFLFRCMAAAVFAFGSAILLSLSVQIWLMPLLAFYFNRISWVAPLANPILVPMASAALAAGIMAALFADVFILGPVLVHLAAGAASFLLGTAEQITRTPGAWQRCPTPPVLLIAVGILALILWSYFRWKRLWIPFGCNLLLLAVWAFGASSPAAAVARAMRKSSFAAATGSWLQKRQTISLTALDVGEGDSIVIRFPDGRVWVLDAGGIKRSSFDEDAGDAFDVGEAVVSRYLWCEWGLNPDRAILSHTDIDHAGGLQALLKNFRVPRLDYPRCLTDALLFEILETARRRKTSANRVYRGMQERVGETAVQILHPPPDPVLPSTNDSSAVLRLSYGRFAALLTGDLGNRGESSLLSYPGDLGSCLLKVAHHGSASGTSSAFLDAVRPQWAVISSGRGNPFGHPSPAVLARLSARNVRVYQTADEGAITFATDGFRYEIHSYTHGILEKGTLK